jgi:hypothetical protein
MLGFKHFGFQFAGITGRHDAGYWNQNRRVTVIVTEDQEVYQRPTGADDGEELLSFIERVCPNGRKDPFQSTPQKGLMAE